MLTTVSVLEVVVLVVDHILLVERLANLAIFVFSSAIAISCAVTHFFMFSKFNLRILENYVMFVKK